nr:hypothetical protein StreXyl84_77430 [Streptomyces sp. Xyl84]
MWPAEAGGAACGSLGAGSEDEGELGGGVVEEVAEVLDAAGGQAAGLVHHQQVRVRGELGAQGGVQDAWVPRRRDGETGSEQQFGAQDGWGRSRAWAEMTDAYVAGQFGAGRSAVCRAWVLPQPASP